MRPLGAEASIGVVHLPSLLTWLCATLLILLFFYGFATLCAMLTGNIIVLPAVYVVLNLVGAGLQVLLNGIVDFFVYGLNGFDALWLIWLSPVVKMLESGMFSRTICIEGQGDQRRYRLEEIGGASRIIRPAYKCVQPNCKYVPLAERSAASGATEQ